VNGLLKLEISRVPALARLYPEAEPERLGGVLLPRTPVLDLKVGGPFLGRAKTPTPDAARAGRVRRRLKGIVLGFEDWFAGGAEIPTVASRWVFGKLNLEQFAENHLYRAAVLVLVHLQHCPSPFIESASVFPAPPRILEKEKVDVKN
jgi:hypothetical protein